jgi:hypothetical protein
MNEPNQSNSKVSTTGLGGSIPGWDRFVYYTKGNYGNGTSVIAAIMDCW